MTQNSISIEIFRDDLTPEVSIQGALKGVAYINSLIDTPLRVESAERTLSFVRTDRAFLTTAEASYTTIPSDIALLVTGRELRLGDARGPAIVGAAAARSVVATKQQATAPIGIISGADERRHPSHLTTAHELGHLLALRYTNDTGAGEHCPDTSCIMYANVLRNNYTGEHINTDFCTPCQRTLARNAFLATQLHGGLFIPARYRQEAVQL